MKIAPHFSVGSQLKRPVRPGGTIEMLAGSNPNSCAQAVVNRPCRDVSHLKNAIPALKYWAIFIASLRDGVILYLWSPSTEVLGYFHSVPMGRGHPLSMVTQH